MSSKSVIITEAVNSLDLLTSIKLLAGLLNLSTCLIDFVAVVNPVAVDINSGGEVMDFTAMLRGTDSTLEISKSSITVPLEKRNIRD